MKILKLKFKNIHSLYGENEIDFTREPLSSAGLYAITGDTGSGKSTILDAMTLGLYGKVSRYDGKISDNIMSGDTADCYAEVHYEVGNIHYISKWSVHRSGKKSEGKVQPAKVEIYNASDDKQLDVSLNRFEKNTEAITGLDYQRFLRSVMLAQNQFQAFIAADEKEKAELLERITGAQIFSDISRKAHKRNKTEKEKLEEIVKDIERLKVLTAEEIKQLNSQLKSNEIRRKVIDEISEKSHKYNDAHINIQKNQEKHQQLINNLDVSTGKIELLKAKSQEVDTMLQKHSQKQVESEGIFTQVDELDRQVKNWQDKIKSGNENKSKIEAELSKNEKDFQAKSNKAEELSKEIAQSEIFLEENSFIRAIQPNISLLESILSSISENESNQKTAKSDIENFSKDKSKNEKDAQNADKLIAELTENIQKLQNNIEQKQSEIQSISAGQDLSGFDEQINILRDANDSLKRMFEISTEYKKKYELLTKTEQESEQTRNNLEQENTVLKTVQEQILSASEHIEKLEIEIRSTKNIADYDTARANLKENEPCPLCGSTHHPYIIEHLEVNLNELEKQLGALKKEEKALQKNKEKHLQAVASFQSKIENNTKQIESIKQDKQTLTSNFSATFESYIQLIVHPAQLVINDIELIEVTLSDNAQKLKQMQDVRKKLNEHLQKKDSYEKELNKANLNLIESKSKHNQIIAEIKNLEEKILAKNNDINNYSAKISEHKLRASSIIKDFKPTIDEFSASALNQIKSSVVQYDKKTEELSSLKIALNELNNTIHILTGKIEDLRARADSAVKQLESFNIELAEVQTERHDLFGKKSVQQERKVLGDQHKTLIDQRQAITNEQTTNITNIEHYTKSLFEINNEINTLSQEKTNLRDDLKTIFSANPETEFDFAQAENSYNTLKRKLQTEIEDLIASITQIRTQLEQNEQSRQQYDMLKIRQDEQKKVSLYWSEIDDLIGQADGTKFKRYAQQLTLKHLVNIANIRLNYLNPRYKIRSGELNAFDLSVIDLEQADNERSIKSLSGGETFLLSLALALALSEIAGRNNEIASLFIDEGFGSLDARSLESALTTLETLQASGKKIGVISHVTEMKERIAVQINVKKLGGGRSNIEMRG